MQVLHGYVISHPKQQHPAERDLQSTWHEQDEVQTVLSRKRQENSVLLELYYLGKVLGAFRRRGAFESPLFKSVLERITNERLMDQLERKLRNVEGFEVIRRIGTDGTIDDPMQVELANDYRLLAPVVLRTLRRLSSLRTSAVHPPEVDDGVLIGELEEEVKSVQEAAAVDESPSESVREEQEDRINFDDYEWTDEEDLEDLEDLEDDRDTGRSAVSATITELIASELDKFLQIVEEISGIAGIAGEFDRFDRERMIDDVTRRYEASVGLDQRFFVDAVKTLLTDKDLYEGRFELLETLDYVRSQLDALEQTERQDYEYKKHYGCYKAGIFFALAIIVLLLVGCLPVFLLTTNNNLILLILLVTLLLIGLATFVYFRWQRSRALAMRRTYEQQKFALTRVHHHAPPPGGPNATPDADGAVKHINATTTYPAATYGQHAASKVSDPMAVGTQPEGLAGTKRDPTTAEGTLQHPPTKSPPRYSFI
uniref:Uncharacterized protein n=1 Tax=Anopheles dirus TaxID=7168 RepID=A0A182MYM3_9DIPT